MKVCSKPNSRKQGKQLAHYEVDLVDGQAHGVAEGLQQRGARSAGGHGVSPAPEEGAARPKEPLPAGRPKRRQRRRRAIRSSV